VVSKSFLDRLVREYQVCANANPDLAVATVAIKSLTSLIVQSNASTVMGLEKEIKEAAAALQRSGQGLGDRVSVRVHHTS